MWNHQNTHSLGCTESHERQLPKQFMGPLKAEIYEKVQESFVRLRSTHNRHHDKKNLGVIRWEQHKHNTLYNLWLQ